MNTMEGKSNFCTLKLGRRMERSQIRLDCIFSVYLYNETEPKIARNNIHGKKGFDEVLNHAVTRGYCKYKLVISIAKFRQCYLQDLIRSIIYLTVSRVVVWACNCTWIYIDIINDIHHWSLPLFWHFLFRIFVCYAAITKRQLSLSVHLN